MMAFTSAKSRLMMPGTVMMSEMPCTACRKISSAIRNASKKLVPRSTVSIKRSFGITMTVSTAPTRSCSACSACIMRRLPSKTNGFVTTATLSAPSSLASEATTGAAPLPVPPPRPEVMKIMSAPSSASMILSVSSSAALRPTSGLAPAPSPLVSFAPSCNFTGACESFSACKSVFAAMNSTPSSFARIMRFTALQPPPPTPMTLIFAGCNSSLKLMRIPASLAVIICRPLLQIRCASSAGSRGTREHGFQFGYQGPRALQAGTAGPGAAQHQSHNRGVLRLSYLFREVRQTFWLRDANGQMKRMLDEVVQPAQARAPTDKNKSSRHLAIEASTLEVIANQREKFHSARLNNIGEHMGKDLARRAVADAGDFECAIVFEEGRGRPAVAALDAFSLWNGCAQAHCKIVGEMVATDWNHADMANDPGAVGEHFGCAAADVEQAAAEVALVLGEAGFGGSERLEHRVTDENAGFVRSGDKILRRGDGRSDYVNVGNEALADHADGIANVVLHIHDKFVRKDVKNFAIFGKRDVARGVHGAADVFALDVARARAQGDAAAAVYTANVMSSNADERFFDRNVCDAFGFFHGAADGADRGIEIDDEAFAQTLGFGGAEGQKLYCFAFEFGDEDGSFRAAYVEPNQVFIFLRQSAAPRTKSILFLRLPCPRSVRDSRPLAASTANQSTARAPCGPATEKN